MKTLFLKIRDFLYYNFGVSIKDLKYKNKDFSNKFIFYFLKLIPFYFLLKIVNYFDIKIIYETDELYFSNYDTLSHIYPVILEFDQVIGNQRISLITQIKKYNGTVPFWFILRNENCYNTVFDIKYLKHGRMVKKSIYLNRDDNRLLHDIYYM